MFEKTPRSNLSGAGAHDLLIAMRIDAICDEFEFAWKGDQRPEIQCFLNSVDHLSFRSSTGDLPRDALFLELMLIDISYRRRTGEVLRLQDYIQMFPEYTKVILKLGLPMKEDLPSE